MPLNQLCLWKNFVSYGEVSTFFGKAKTILAPEDNSLVRQALETKGNNQVLVIDGGASRACALVGDQLALLAIENEWAGIIVNGYIKRLGSHLRNAYRYKALGTNPRKSIKKNRGEVDIQLTIAQIPIKPRSWIYSDADGIIISEHNLLASE